ncbi:BSD domain-containing protein 1-A-like [Uranotaenia lowii]|uniref:BSD domain-containing protein 1-A-like n=1 Tax=Uranotaenia lowii TaxID=190385 RepID=UPI00247AF77B|nr:BSD domain-containing protein 1-A-like [Uranotaenia lowii]
MADKSQSDKSPEKESPASPTGSASGGGSSWWGSWLDTAKTRSASVLEAVRNDLTELTTAVKTEATSATEALGRTLSLGGDSVESGTNSGAGSGLGAMKKSFSTFLTQVTEALVPALDDEEEGEDVLITSEATESLTGFHRHLAELQAMEGTYLEEPSDELSEKYKRWMEVVEQEQFTEPRLARHLASSTILNENYTKLVPAKVAHMDFWKRYLFKKALLEDAIANAEIADRKAKAAVASTETVAPKKVIVQTDQPKRTIEEELIPEMIQELIPEEIAWAEIPEFDASNMELSEEEQARLLEEYELECKEREKAIACGRMDPVDEALLIQSDVEKTPQKKPPSPVTSPAKKPAAKKSTNLQQQSQSANNRNQNQKSQQKGAKNASKPGNKQKVTAKQQQNELQIEKNHFTKDDVSSSNSDESWEKEFDLE